MSTLSNLSTLTPEELNVRLAKALRWNEIQIIEDEYVGLPPEAKWLEAIPSFCTDLNETAKVEDRLSPIRLVRYRRNLTLVIWDDGEDGDEILNLIRATARQRTIALILTLESKQPNQ
jgi:hypothetical protein